MVSVDSSAIELTDAQTAVLSALVTIHSNRGDGPIKGKRIAEAIDRNAGTIRTQMQSLKSLQLVKGIPGPKGGYEPTAKAYELVDLEQSTEFAPVPIRRDREPLDGVTATEFDLLNLHHPDRHEAEVHVQGAVHQFSQGDSLRIGPTPSSGLVVSGRVEGVDTAENICVITVDDMHFDASDARDGLS